MYRCGYGPIVTPTRYVVRDFFFARPVPVIHPVVNVNRNNIFDVPQNFYQFFTRNVAVNRGFIGGF